ncbi:MAG: hypothetical protein WC768_04665 [Patescibacteria group bacterium]|jgi:amino acid transporter
MKNLKKQIISLAILTVLFLLPIYHCQATTITDKMKGAISSVDLPSGGEDAALRIVGKTISAFLGLFGIIFMILVIYGGYKWMMASGREEEVKKAKDIIKQAVIGLIVVMMAYAISFFVSYSLQQAVTK